MDPRLFSHGGLRLLAILVFTASVALLLRFTVDDAFITFRYAHNLADGFGPVYNTDGTRAEGYTSVLWLLLMAIPERFGLDTVRVAKGLGICASVITMLLVGRLVDRLSDDLTKETRSLSITAAILFLGTSRMTAVHAVSGMETALCSCLVALFAFLLVESLRRRTTMLDCATGLVGLCLGLTRPEMNVLVIVGLCIAIKWTPSDAPRRAASFLTTYVIPGLAYYAWRFQFYGLPFPLPFYVKGTRVSGLGARMDAAWYALYIVAHFGLFIACALVRPRRSTLVVLGLGMLLTVAYVVPASIMNFDWRYQSVTLPLFVTVAAAGVGKLIAAVASNSESAEQHKLRLPAIVWLLLFCVPPSISDLRATARSYREKLTYAHGLAEAHGTLGAILRDVRHRVGFVPSLGISDAGLVPYISGWNTLDTFGLNDPHIATHGPGDANYVLGKELDVVVLLSSKADLFRPILDWEAELFDGVSRTRMRQLGSLAFNDNYYLWVFVARDSKASATLDSAWAASGRSATEYEDRFEPGP